MAVASRTWTASYGRYVQLRITAQEVEVDVPNNRSKVRVTGNIYYPGGTRATNAYPQTYTVTVDGTQIGRQTGITYNLASGGTRSLTTYTSGWINHNSNGAKSVTVRGHITDSAGDTGTISQSYALTTIARASTLSSFSMPYYLKPSTATTFSLGITRRSSSFRHDIQLRDGNTVIASWTGQGTPSSLSLTSSQTNTLLSRMSSSTSRTMTLRVQTKSGSTNIGGALTRTATVYVHSSVTPNVSGLSVAIEGNTHAKNTVKRFVQNISRVSGKFTRSATGGASISSSKLEIRRKSGGSDLQTINSNSGTFSRAVALNGQYQARGTATDSRGRSSNTGWVDLSNFNVLAYSAPQITRFSTNRQTGTETTVDIVRNGTHSGLSGSNVLTIRLQKRASGEASWVNVVSDVTTTSNTFGATIPSTGYSVASSYEFKLYVVDQFGNSAEQISTVTTQRVVLDIHKNEGVGIGKIHEKGVLDVDGDAFFRGPITITTEASDGNVTPITGQYMSEAHTGVLIDVCDTTLENMVTIRITGNGYFSKPIFTILQAYHYNTLGDFREVRQTNFGDPLPRALIFIQGGRVKVWVPRSERFQSFIIEAWGKGGRVYTTKIESMSAIPTNVTHAHSFDTLLPFKNNVNGKNMNDVLESGFYYGYTQTNSAVKTISGFLVINYSKDWVTQLQFVPGDNSDIYIRHKYNGTNWSTWRNKK